MGALVDIMSRYGGPEGLRASGITADQAVKVISRGDIYNLDSEDVAELEAFFGKQAARDAIAANSPPSGPALNIPRYVDQFASGVSDFFSGGAQAASEVGNLAMGVGQTLFGTYPGANPSAVPPTAPSGVPLTRTAQEVGMPPGGVPAPPAQAAAPPPPAPPPDQGPIGPVNTSGLWNVPGTGLTEQQDFQLPTDDAQMEEATNWYDNVYEQLGKAMTTPEMMFRIGQQFLKPRFGDTWTQATAAASDVAGVAADQIAEQRAFLAGAADKLNKAQETKIWQAIQAQATQGRTVNLPPELAAGLAVSDNPNMQMMGLIALANPGGLNASAVSLATGLMKIAQTSDEKAKEREFERWKLEVQEAGRNSRALIAPLANMAFLGPEYQEKAMAAIQQAMNMKQDEADEEFLAK